MNVDVHNLSKFTEKEREIFEKSVFPLLKNVLNDPEFKERILSFSYVSNGKVLKKFKSDKGYGRPRIWRMIESGADVFNTEQDGDMDISLEAFYSRRSTIGYTNTGTFKSWINRKFFSHWLKTPQGHTKLVGNLVHEYMHNLGFDHAMRDNCTRKYTVPYAIGYIAEEIALKYI